LELNGACQLPFYDEVNLLDEITNTTKENTEALLETLGLIRQFEQ
jgi:hypothetical protein